MIAPNMPPMVPPTIAVWRFSFWQSFVMGVEVGSNGEPVEMAVATAGADGEVVGAGVAVDS
jgi:hypothetical protein